jgi:hypothetical protein
MSKEDVIEAYISYITETYMVVDGVVGNLI